MNYTLPISWQVNTIFLSLGLGLILGLAYEVFLSIRKVFSDKTFAYIIQDVSFSVLSTLVYFSFMLVFCEGEVRLISVSACVLGICVFHYTIGRLISSSICLVIEKVKSALRIIFTPLIKLYSMMKDKISSALKKMINFIKGKKIIDFKHKKSKKVKKDKKIIEKN